MTYAVAQLISDFMILWFAIITHAYMLIHMWRLTYTYIVGLSALMCFWLCFGLFVRHVCTFAPLIYIELSVREDVVWYALFPGSFQVAMAATVSAFCIVIRGWWLCCIKTAISSNSCDYIIIKKSNFLMLTFIKSSS